MLQPSFPKSFLQEEELGSRAGQKKSEGGGGNTPLNSRSNTAIKPCFDYYTLIDKIQEKTDR